MNKAASAMPESLKFFINCLFASFTGIVIMSLATVISAFLLTYTENPEGFYLVCITVAKILCGFIAGRTAIRKNRRYALVCGAVTSLFIMGMLWFVALFMPECGLSSRWWQTLLIPLCAIAGAVISNKE